MHLARAASRAVAGPDAACVGHAPSSSSSSSARSFSARLVSILITAGIICVLLFETVEFLREVPIVEFLFGTEWTPLFSDKHFGVLPLVSGTLLASAIAMVVALPAGLLTAIYLSEYAAARGCAGLSGRCSRCWPAFPPSSTATSRCSSSRPCCRSFVPGLAGFNALGPGIVMGIMILPLVSSLSEDALHSVPNGLREGSYALGSTQMQTALRVVVPAAFSGISAAAILAVSRAIGETMIVAIAAGQQPRLTLRPARAGRDDDRLHRPGEPGRHAGRHARVPDDLRGRHAAVPQHVRAEPASRTGCGTASGRSTHERAHRRPCATRTARRSCADRRSAARAVRPARRCCWRWRRSAALLYDIARDGLGRLSWQFLTQLSVAASASRPAFCRRSSAASTSSASRRSSPCRSASGAAHLPRGVRERRAGCRGSSRSTSPTWRACRRSSTDCSGSACSSASSAWAEACWPARARWRCWCCP